MDLQPLKSSRLASAGGKEAPPLISAVVCAAGDEGALADTVIALLGQDFPPHRREIVVVRAMAHPSRFAWPSGVRTIVTASAVTTSAAPGTARDAGLAAARGEVVAFLDEGALPEPLWCAALAAAFEARPGAKAIGGYVGFVWPDHPPGWLGAWRRGEFGIVGLGGGPAALEEQEWLLGNNLAVRNAAASEAGGFRARPSRANRAMGNAIGLLGMLFGGVEEVSYDAAIRVRQPIDASTLTPSWLCARQGRGELSEQLLACART